MLSLLCLIKHTILHLPLWLISMNRQTIHIKTSFYMGVYVQGKGPQVNTNKGQVIIPKWSQVQEAEF